MKKNVLFLLFAIVNSLATIAQTIDYFDDNRNFFILSPNGRYSAGAIESFPAFFYDIVEKNFSYCEPEFDRGYFTTAINNEGRVAGAVEHKAAIWEQGGKWTMLPIPSDIIDSAELWTIAYGISNDSKTLVVSIGETPIRHVIYDLQEDGTYNFTDLPIPKQDPIYRKRPMWISICGMSGDGNRVVGRFMTNDGFREMPLVWERGENNEWTYRFLQVNNLVKEGEVIPNYPDENDPNFSDLLYEYWLTTQEIESGIYHNLNGATISNNGRYIATKVGVQNLSTDDWATVYGAVIDIDKDTMYIFDKLPNATCLSVTNEGIASFGTPAVEYFRYAYVASVNDTENIIPLDKWCLEQTNGNINLADYMMYPIDDSFVPVLATGTATLSSEGKGFMTYQWNLIETGWQETFFVLFGEKTAIDIVKNNELIVSPNPTNGIINLSLNNIERIDVFDMLGRKVFTQSILTNQIDLSDLEKGNYIIVAKQNDKLIKSKIIIL